MARGDYIEVVIGVATGTIKTKVTASRVGGVVKASISDREWTTVTEMGRTGDIVQEARFAKGAVLQITEGHDEAPKRTRKKAS